MPACGHAADGPGEPAGGAGGLLPGTAVALALEAGVLAGSDVLLPGVAAAGAPGCPAGAVPHPARTASPAAKARTGQRRTVNISLTPGRYGRHRVGARAHR